MANEYTDLVSDPDPNEAIQQLAVGGALTISPIDKMVVTPTEYDRAST